MRIDQCRSCKAAVYWAQTQERKWMPVDAAITDNGTAILSEQPAIGGGTLTMVRIVKSGEPRRPGEQRRMPHWATCPNAASHRKPPPASATSNPDPDPKHKPTLEKLLILVAGRADALTSLANDCETARDTEAADMLRAFRGIIPWRIRIADQARATQAVERELLRLLYAADGGGR